VIASYLRHSPPTATARFASGNPPVSPAPRNVGIPLPADSPAPARKTTERLRCSTFWKAATLDDMVSVAGVGIRRQQQATGQSSSQTRARKRAIGGSSRNPAGRGQQGDSRAIQSTDGSCQCPGSVHIARCRSCFAVPIIRMLWRLCVARFATPWCLHALTLPNAVWSNCCTWPATLSRLRLPTHAWFLVPLPNDIGLQTGDRIRLDNVEQGCAEGQAPVQIRRGLTRWESPSPQFLLRSTNVWLLPRAPSSLSQVGSGSDHLAAL
jgi:hypothetical protein